MRQSGAIDSWRPGLRSMSKPLGRQGRPSGHRARYRELEMKLAVLQKEYADAVGVCQQYVSGTQIHASRGEHRPREHPAEVAVDSGDEVQEFAAGRSQADDMSLLVIHRTP